VLPVDIVIKKGFYFYPAFFTRRDVSEYSDYWGRTRNKSKRSGFWFKYYGWDFVEEDQYEKNKKKSKIWRQKKKNIVNAETECRHDKKYLIKDFYLYDKEKTGTYCRLCGKLIDGEK